MLTACAVIPHASMVTFGKNFHLHAGGLKETREKSARSPAKRGNDEPFCMREWPQLRNDCQEEEQQQHDQNGT
jgi:hypothetical protein